MGARLAWVSLGCVLGALLAPWPGGRVRAVAQGAGQLTIEAGWFHMGSRQAEVDYARRLCVKERVADAFRLRGCAEEILFGDELGERRVYLSTYGLDRTEVTRAAYQRCVVRGHCTPSHLVQGHPELTAPDRPISAITWAQAAEVCAFQGGRLPTEAEWERAARGLTRRRFPWGRHYDPRLANHGGPTMSLDPLVGRPALEDGYRYASPVGAFASAASAAGALDMAGNVWEWTADGYAPAPELSRAINPRGAGDTGVRVVRGGSWRSPAFTLRVTHRGTRPEGGHWVDVGVRCAYDPAPQD